MAEHLLILNAAEGLLQFQIVKRDPSDDGLASSSVPLCFQTWHAPAQGAEMLMPALRDACERLHLSLADISRIACVRGPGSFTGLRLTLASAAGLARATGALQAGVEYLPLLALSAFLRFSPALYAKDATVVYWVLTHARRQLVHLQGFALCSTMLDRASLHNNDPGEFTTTAKELRPLSEIMVCSPEEAGKRIFQISSALPDALLLLLGSGLTTNRPVFQSSFAKSSHKFPVAGDPCRAPILLSSIYDHPSAESLHQAAANLEFSREDIFPHYVRPADAVENLESIARILGLNPEEAWQKYAQLTGLPG